MYQQHDGHTRHGLCEMLSGDAQEPHGEHEKQNHGEMSSVQDEQVRHGLGEILQEHDGHSRQW